MVSSAERLTERFTARKRRERHDMILKETAAILSEQGCCRSRVEDIAQRVGVGKGTIYLDFGSKEDLIATSLARCSDELVSLLEEKASRDERSGNEVVKTVRALVEVAGERPDLIRLIEHRVPCETTPNNREVAPASRLEEHLTQRIQSAQGTNALSADVEPRVAASMMVQAISSPVWRELAAREGAERAMDQVSKAFSSRSL